MPIQQPSQYQCDNMEPGDVIFVCNRGPVYKFLREHYRKDALKIKVKTNWKEPYEYKTYYQEDCTLLYSYELKCIQTYSNKVPYMVNLDSNSKGLYTKYLKELKVGLYNIQLILNSGIMITIPTQDISRAIETNKKILSQIDDDRLIENNLKFATHKGDYFKNRVIEHNLTTFEASYCPVCGKPLVFSFNEDVIEIENKCECGNTTINASKMSYDEFAIWYYSLLGTSAEKRNKDFWFGDVNTCENK